MENATKGYIIKLKAKYWVKLLMNTKNGEIRNLSVLLMKLKRTKKSMFSYHLEEFGYTCNNAFKIVLSRRTIDMKIVTNIKILSQNKS